MLRKLLQFLIIIFTAVSISYSQAPKGEMVSYNIIGGGDTLVLNRTYGDWWYGISGGLQMNNYFGSLNVPTHNQTENPFNQNINFETGSGAGYFFGGLAEWKPKGEKWGVSIILNLLDKRMFTANAKIDSVSDFEINSSIQQLILSPTVKYYLPVEGLFLKAGLNLDYVLKNSRKTIESSGSQIENNNDFKAPTIGFGLNMGFGFDIFVADVSGTSRLMLTPFADLGIRSSVISDNSSSWYSTTARFGFAISIGKDEIVYDTLQFDPTYETMPQYLATIKREEGITFMSRIRIDEQPAANIEYIERSQVKAEIGETTRNNNDTTERIFAELPAKKAQPEKIIQSNVKKKDIVVKKGTTEKFSFPTSTSTSISVEMKEYLDKAADYLFLNPSARIILIGHSDNRGTLEENAKRAQERAKNAEKYLLGLNVPKNRIIASWKGSLSSIAPNDTEEGRRQNRRVEVKIED